MAMIPKWTDQRVEEIIGNLLRTGVMLSAAIVLIGAAIFLVRHGMTVADYRVFKGEPTDLRTVHGIVEKSLHLSGRGIIQLGLLLLIATPVARVAFAVYGFAAEGDRLYVGFTIVVLLVLLYSLIGGS
ncbi:MAG TPA: DUF1634 domain-containing protein [Nitrospira sp.]|nr:DUF1634 domain-containing protein [Nitrospira sp.]